MADLEDSALKRQLVAELHSLALRGRNRWFRGTTLEPLEVPHIRAISIELYGGSSVVENSEDPIEAAVSIMLTNMISQLPRTLVPHSAVTWQWVGEVLMGFRQIPVNRKSGLAKEYNKIVDYIREVSKYPDRIDRLTGAVREKLAGILIEQLEASRFAQRERSSGRYATRTTLETAIYQEVSRAGRLVLIHGDAGAGKSTLALRVAERCAGRRRDKLFRIDASDIEVLVADVYECLYRLSAIGDSFSGPPLVLLRRFAIALSELNESRVLVLIDGLDDDALAGLMARSGLCPHPKATVLLTSRSVLFRKKARLIHVPNMSKAEATDMIERRLPGTSKVHASALAGCLDYRPLAIVHGLTLLTLAPTPNIPEFCSLLRTDAAATLAIVPSDRTLTAIYSRLLDRMTGNPDMLYARKLLELFCFLSSRVPISLLEAVWHEHEDGDDAASSVLSSYIFRTALARLEELNLIRVDRKGNSATGLMHELTHQILCSLTGRYKPTHIPALLRVFHQHLDEERWHAEQPFKSFVIVAHMSLALHDYLVSLGAEHHRFFESEDPLPLARVLSAVLRSMRQLATDGEAYIRSINDFAYRYQEFSPFSEFQELYAAALASGFPREDTLMSRASISAAIYSNAQAPALFDAFIGEDISFSANSPEVLPSYGSLSVGIPVDMFEIRKRLSEAATRTQQGLWVLADAGLEAAFAESNRLNRAERMELQASACRLALKVSVRGNNLPRLKLWADRAEELISIVLSENDSVGRFLSMTRLKHARHLAYVHEQAQADFGGQSFIDSAYELAGRYDDLLAEYAGQHQPYFMRLLHYDRLSVSTFISPCDAENDIRAFHFADDIHSPPQATRPTCVLAAIAQAKNMLSHSAVHDEDNGVSLEDRIEGLADTVNELCGIAGVSTDGRLDPSIGLALISGKRVPNYHRADALLTATVIATYIGVGDNTVAILRNAANELLANIGRTDRLATAERVAQRELPLNWLFAS